MYLWQKPEKQARDNENDENDGNGIDDEFAHESEQCTAVEPP